MPRRPASVTQADIARAIRALRDAGVPVERLRLRMQGGSVVVEIGDARLTDPPDGGERKLIAL